MRMNPRKKVLQLALFLAAAALVLLLMQRLFPEQFDAGTDVMAEYGREIILVFPAVLILMGLADVWVPDELVRRYLGTQSGIRGLGLSIAVATVPAGPLFVAFPIAGELLRKGASVVNIVAFLGTWAALKAPEIGLEIHFIGLRFALLRAGLSLIAIIGIAVVTAKLAGQRG